VGRHSSSTSWEELFAANAQDAPTRTGSDRWAAVPTLLVGAVLASLIMTLLIAPFVTGPALAVRTASDWWHNLPTELPLDEALPLRTVLTDKNGKPFASLFGENRVPLSLQQINPYVVAALLATEDDRFYEHGALDPKGLVRAFLRNQGGASLQGGSTISQQYVKNLLLTNATTDANRSAVTAATLDRKLREARLAVALELRLTKDQILQGYLNTVNFGGGAYGIGAASLHYFSIPAASLTISQAATLIALLKAPTYYSPVTYPKNSLRRRNTVINRMLRTGRITVLQAKAALATKQNLTLSDPPSGCAVSTYPFYCAWVKQILETDPVFGATPEARQQELYHGGFTIRTALDPAVMAAAEVAARRALTATNRVAAAVAVVVPGTGAVAAIATSRSWGVKVAEGQTEVLLPTVPAFQPGSTFKAFTLATAIEQGIPLTTTFDTPDGYQPAGLNYPAGGFHNDNNRNNGVLNAYQATARSVNTWFIQLEQQTGVLPIADMATRLGITSLIRQGPDRITSRDGAFTLGTAEVSPLDMASAYATFAAGGVACRPIAILSMTDRAGVPAPVPSAQCHQAISPTVATLVTDVLRAPFGSDGTAAGLALSGRSAAGKTGTTNNSAATWFTGFTPQYSTSVWVGDPRGGQKYPLRNVLAYGTTFAVVYGGSIAGPIWRDVMTTIQQPLPVVDFPSAQGLVDIATVVPDVRGLRRDDAITALLDAGYRVNIAPLNAAAGSLGTPGFVAAQSVAPGSRASLTAIVTLTLTAGSSTQVTIPEPWQRDSTEAP
jgi:membrane peptidoglycan carboxypeptidase